MLTPNEFTWTKDAEQLKVTDGGNAVGKKQQSTPCSRRCETTGHAGGQRGRCAPPCSWHRLCESTCLGFPASRRRVLKRLAPLPGGSVEYHLGWWRPTRPAFARLFRPRCSSELLLGFYWASRPQWDLWSGGAQGWMQRVCGSWPPLWLSP